MGPVELLGWTGSVLVVVSLTQSKLKRLRVINLGASLLHLAFNVILGIVPMIALNLVLTGVNSYYLFVDRPKTGRTGGPRSGSTGLRAGPYRPALPMVGGFATSEAPA